MIRGSRSLGDGDFHCGGCAASGSEVGGGLRGGTARQSRPREGH